MLDGGKIKARRQKLGLTLAGAARAAGWWRNGRTRWHDLETGRYPNVKLKTLASIARVLECGIEDLINHVEGER
jgi:transcriptional regulator with XRE-family HTH domain